MFYCICLTEAMKILGMVNKYNRGIAKANKELEKNGNPRAQFDINKLTEFRVTIVSNGKSGTINSESGQIKWPDKEESGQINSGVGRTNSTSDAIISENGEIKSGQINPKSGLINSVKPYDTESQDLAVLELIRNRPGIKVEAVFLEIKTSTRSVRRVLERLAQKDKIEYRGSKRTGGWFVKT